VFDVNCCMFFPSGKVILTGGMDMRMRIYSIDGSCAATLQGHKRSRFAIDIDIDTSLVQSRVIRLITMRACMH
jgi:hypothetical protein